MKRIEEELRIIRQQMEQDFLLHSERISAQKQSLERVETALERVGDSLEIVDQKLIEVKDSVSRVSDAIGSTQDAVTGVSREFRDFAHTTGSYHETWATERKRNLRLLDVIQTGILTGGLETDSRLERIERRLTRLEKDQSGAA